MNTKINLNAILQYFLLYIALIFQGAILFKVYQDVIIIFTIVISSLICLKFTIKNKLITKKNLNEVIVFPMGMLILLLSVSFSTNGSLSLATILNYISRFMIIFAAYHFNKEKFSARFIRLSVFFAIISLCGFVIEKLGALSVFNLFLQLNPGDQSNSRGMLFYSYNSINGGRNQGIYGEPGLYQIVLNVTLYMLLFLPKIKHRKRGIVVIVATIITTMSTTGYFSLIAILIVNSIVNKKMNNKTSWLTILLCIVMAVFYFNASKDSFIYEKFFNKFIDNSGAINFNLSTGQARTTGMSTDIELIKKNPWGLGANLYAYKYSLISTQEGLSTSGLTRFIAIVGVIPAFWIIGFMIFKLFVNSSSFIDFILRIFIIVNTTLGQPQFLFPVLLVFCLININDWKRYSSEKYSHV